MKTGNSTADQLLDQAEAAARFAVARDKTEAAALRRRAAAGRITQDLKGLYVRPAYFEGLNPRERAKHRIRALAFKNPEWVFASFSAALAYGLQVPYSLLETTHVAVGSGRSRRRGGPGVVCHQVVGDAHAITDGIRVTSLERTLLDCMRTADFCQGLAILDSALHNRLIDKETLGNYLELHGRWVPGVVRAREVLRWADGRSENGGESMARGVMIELGFEAPELQFEIEDPMSQGVMKRSDFKWTSRAGALILGELDGKTKYVGVSGVHVAGRGTAGYGAASVDHALEVMEKERLRESRLSLAGATIVRFSFAEAMDREYMLRLLTCAGVPRRDDAAG